MDNLPSIKAFKELIDDIIKEDMSDLAQKMEQGFKEYFADPWKYADEHRRGISDMKWADMQQMGDPIYSHGDIVEFKVGGFGRIRKVQLYHNGWPCSYAVMRVPNKPFHATNKCAWHYEGDIERLVGESSDEVKEIIQQLNGDHEKSLIAHIERSNNE